MLQIEDLGGKEGPQSENANQEFIPQNRRDGAEMAFTGQAALLPKKHYTPGQTLC